MESIWIKEIKADRNCVTYHLDVSEGLVRYFSPSCEMFAEFGFDVSNIPKSVLAVPVLSNIMQFAWLFDCLVWIEEVDQQFYECLPKIKRGFQEMYRNYSFGGSLIAAKVVNNGYHAEKESALLFTGGVDATTSFLRIRDSNPVLIDTFGWCVDRDEESRVFEADISAINKFAEENHLQTEYIKSNFATFIRPEIVNKYLNKRLHNSWWFGFQHSLAFLGVASIVAYYFRIKTIYIGSSYTFGQAVNCVSDPRIDREFKVASCNVVHDAYELSRQEKIRMIVKAKEDFDLPINLRVCSFKEENCNHCEKCFRTMIGIVAEGGNVNDFGFHVEGNFCEALAAFLRDNVKELDKDHIVFWRDIIARMAQNYNELPDKETADYLTLFNFEKEKRECLWRYYRENFFSIIKRKLKGIIKRG